jgi:pimeloyl-ACP methyl ester carboxylesterase
MEIQFINIPTLKGYQEFRARIIILDNLRILLGNYFSEKYLGHSFRKIDLRKECNNLDIPIFFIQGAHDWLTPTVLVKQYFKSLKAH